MNDGGAERRYVLRVQLARTVPHQSLLAAAVEDVVLAPAVDADHRPHAMVVGPDEHAGPPAQVEYRQVSRFVEDVHARDRRLAQLAHDLAGIPDGPRHQLLDRGARLALL